MNGGRLSNDETFLQGAVELRLLLQAAIPDGEAGARAVARIGVRYPEEAEQLSTLWQEREYPACGALLAAIEAQHQTESDNE